MTSENSTSTTTPPAQNVSAQPEHSATSDSSQKKKSSRVWLRVLFLLVACAIILIPGSKIYRSQKQKSFKTACKTAVEDKQWQALYEVSKRWRDWDPQSDDALIYLTEAHIQQGEYEQAAQRLGQVDDSYHGALESIAAQAELLYSELNKPYEAEKAWKRMLEINKLADVPRQRLIFFYAMSLQRKKMVELIHESMRLGCEPPEAYTYLMMVNALNFSDGLLITTRWLQTNPGDETFEVAQAIYAAKKTADNGMATFGIQTLIPGDRSLLDKCLEKYPSNLEALALQIEYMIFEGKADEVGRLMGQAAPEAENDSRFWRYRAWLLENKQKYDAAIDSLKQALKINPYDWQARWLMADIYRKMGETNAADKMAQLAATGKELQTELFTLRRAGDLSEEVVFKIVDYLRSLGPTPALQAMEKRL